MWRPVLRHPQRVPKPDAAGRRFRRKCEITYYDDEELDSYRDRKAADYSPDDIDRFRDVLYTLLPSDLMGWQRSLKRRGIAMPDPIHDEFIMLYNEHSGKGQQ